MAKCIWCGKRDQLNKYKFCPECYDTIKDDIVRCKDRLGELEKKAHPEMSETEQKEILTQLREYCDILKGYKEKDVPFFKSGYVPLQNKVYAKLGMPVEVPTLRRGSKIFKIFRMINFQSIVNFLVLPLLVFACVYLFVNNQSYSKQLAALQGTPEGEPPVMDSVPGEEDPVTPSQEGSSTPSASGGRGGGTVVVSNGSSGRAIRMY